MRRLYLPQQFHRKFILRSSALHVILALQLNSEGPARKTSFAAIIRPGAYSPGVSSFRGLPLRGLHEALSDPGVPGTWMCSSFVQGMKVKPAMTTMTAIWKIQPLVLVT